MKPGVSTPTCPTAMDVSSEGAQGCEPLKLRGRFAADGACTIAAELEPHPGYCRCRRRFAFHHVLRNTTPLSFARPSRSSLQDLPVNRFILLLILSFAGSAASVLAGRGVYFFAFNQFGFDDSQNLWLALGSGAMYVIGALPSHALALRFGERNLMLIAIVPQIICLGAMCLLPRPAVIVAGLLLFQFCNALMWPVVESYVSAGRSPRETARALGRFNITWALATPLAVLWIGPIIQDLTNWLFGIGAAMFILVGVLTSYLPGRIAHLAHDDPQRMSPQRREAAARLLVSSRWLLLYSYALFYLLVPLFPQLFERLGYDVEEKTRLASVTDFARWFTFLCMHLAPWWHDRASVLWAAIVLLPASALVILLVPDAGVIVGGEIVFGIVEGGIYYAALYYAMVVKNASVDAGGAHESLIGLGYTIGPVAGLIGFGMAGKDWMFQFWPMLLGIGPVVLVCTVGAVWPLVRRRAASQ